ncbi:MAG: glycosyltransferase family 2 protein [Sulfuricella sp.]
MIGQISPSCDVVIVNYNAGGFLSGCVASALAQGVRSVIVVDNASVDDSLALLEQACPDNSRLKILRNAANLGFAAACNIGIHASTQPFVLFLNPDATLAPGALACLMEALVSTEDAGMAGGLLCNPDGSEQPGGRRIFPTPGRAFMRAFGLSRLAGMFPGRFPDFLLHEAPLPAEPVVVEAISGACMLVKRAAMNDVGLWDEGYFLHCEDLDWCMRFRQKGWRILFVPGAKVIHQWGGCSRARPVFVEWHKHKGMMRFYRKFFRQQYPGALMWLVALGVWLRFGAVAAYYTVRRLLGGGHG